jgi:two-component sensor histidine kinase/putative methionine-R-sulfoxide reductase with GAF domain
VSGDGVTPEADQLVSGWLDALARAGNSLAEKYGRRRLRALLRHCLTQPAGASVDGALASVPAPDLESAAQLLRAEAAALSLPEDLRNAVAVLSSTLEEAARRAPAEPARPAQALWLASVAIESARTPAKVAEAVVEGARQLSRARSAVWWERQDGRLHALAASGADLPEERRSFRPPVGFWTSHVTHGGGLVELSAEVPEHAAFLSRFGVRRGVIARARATGRWQGALSVHGGNLGAGRTDLLLALVEQGAAAMHALALALSPWPPGAEDEPAMASAVSLDDLLDRACRLMAEAVAGASFLFLADEAHHLQLRRFAGVTAEEAHQAQPELAAAAARVHAGDLPEMLEIGPPAPAGLPLPALRDRGFRTAFGIPLEVRGHRLGVAIVLARRPDPAEERARALGLAVRLAAEIETMQLLETAQRRLTEISDLSRMGRRVVSTLDLDSIARTVAQSAAEVLAVPRAAIFIATEEGDFRALPAGQIGFPEPRCARLPASGHLGAQALQAQAALAEADAQAAGRADDPLVLWMEARAIACAPMIAPQGLRGFLVVADSAPHSFELNTRSLLSSHANQGALALQGAVLYRQAVERLRRLSKLAEMSEALTSSQTAAQSAGILLRSAVALFDAPVGMVWLVEPGTGDLVLTATHGLCPAEWAMQRVKSGEDLAGLAAQSRRPLVSVDITRDGRFPYRQQARKMGLGPATAAPLLSQGRVMGVLSLYRRAPSTFTEDDRDLIMSMANNAAIALENAHLLEEAQRRAEFVAAMMSEVNHRMRNSLQSVAGLLRMELERPRMRSVEDTVRRALSHIQAVAAVHEVVREPEVYLVDVKEVALRVAKLPRTGEGRHVEVQVSGTRVLLPSQRAISVALVLNELVDNAIQHGLAGVEGGRVSVSLAEGGGEVVVQVRSPGAGPPKDFDLQASPGLGLKIVRGLVEEELGGRLELETKNGFVVRARFPKVD